MTTLVAFAALGLAFGLVYVIGWNHGHDTHARQARAEAARAGYGLPHLRVVRPGRQA